MQPVKSGVSANGGRAAVDETSSLDKPASREDRSGANEEKRPP